MPARSSRRLIAWIVCCAVLFGAVLPSSAHGRGGVDVPLAPLCAVTVDGPQSGGDGAPAAPAQAGDCPCCVASCGPIGVPGAQSPGRGLAGASTAVLMPLRAERLPPAPRATGAPPRAPPA